MGCSLHAPGYLDYGNCRVEVVKRFDVYNGVKSDKLKGRGIETSGRHCSVPYETSDADENVWLVNMMEISVTFDLKPTSKLSSDFHDKRSRAFGRHDTAESASQAFGLRLPS
ncbi:hypothetical protein F441_10646 [Phytophthora nicotianae CJ01A1]|uniref:Uncharacterized protein n=2 Tax=Phytophthora nicotianae TaxID=4792 RepID=W2GNL2_PHYNI|nr:hypothetical protein L915_10465 [Phytophthora nicotianae]ETL38009.1 hypothetical protein L916_10358 [Phytophthora nicotianae]ETP14414.1 hypothetical protein F441_10646 [Phytophthora nicotianae CJ01A1]